MNVCREEKERKNLPSETPTSLSERLRPHVAVSGVISIIHAEGVQPKKMEEFRLRSPRAARFNPGLGARQVRISVRAKSVTLGEQTRVNSRECRSVASPPLTRWLWLPR